MSREKLFPEVVDGGDIDLDTEEVRAPNGTRLTEADAERTAEDVLQGAGRPSLTAPGQHSPQVTFRLPEEVKESLEQIASEQGRSRSDVMRDALAEYVGRASSRRNYG